MFINGSFFPAEAIELENGTGVRRGSHPVLVDVAGAVLCWAFVELLLLLSPGLLPLRRVPAGAVVPNLFLLPLCARLFPLIPPSCQPRCDFWHILALPPEAVAPAPSSGVLHRQALHVPLHPANNRKLQVAPVTHLWKPPVSGHRYVEESKSLPTWSWHSSTRTDW